jgi:hypothetical protein
MHKRPAADQFMREAKRLRSENASEEKIRGAAEVLYPTGSAALKSVRSMRSRFLRACTASDQNFAHAEGIHTSGGHIGKIVGGLDKRSAAGAPKRNLNALGKKRDFSLNRFNAMWRAMSPADQDKWIKSNKLRRHE